MASVIFPKALDSINVFLEVPSPPPRWRKSTSFGERPGQERALRPAPLRGYIPFTRNPAQQTPSACGRLGPTKQTGHGDAHLNRPSLLGAGQGVNPEDPAVATKTKAPLSTTCSAVIVERSLSISPICATKFGSVCVEGI